MKFSRISSPDGSRDEIVHLEWIVVYPDSGELS